MDDQPWLAAEALLSPPFCFLPSAWVCGAGWASDLEIPAPLPKLLFPFLLLAIRLSGVAWKLQQSGPWPSGGWWTVFGGRWDVGAGADLLLFFGAQAGADALPHAAAIGRHPTDRSVPSPSSRAESFLEYRHPPRRFMWPPSALMESRRRSNRWACCW